VANHDLPGGPGATAYLPKRHYLDRRAADLAEEGRGKNSDDLLTTPAVADWLRISPAWLEIGRSKGYGPRFVRLSPRRVRYHRADVLAWLAERTHRSTAAYAGDGK
jgi:predicted DNA-binding transcriptional regulator AlpA